MVILIACVDSLTGFPAAIEAAYPRTEVQKCVIHQIRNTTQFFSYKDIKALMADLKRFYAAVDESAALADLDRFEEIRARNTRRFEVLGAPTGRI